MMISILKTLSLFGLLGIIYQDFKERQVYLWLFVSVGIILTITFFQNTSPILYSINISINILIISIVVSVLFLYTKYILKKSFRDSIGLGDLVFFMCMAISFPTVAFIVLFTFSLFFASLLYAMLKPNLKQSSVPLAGLQALFLFLIIGANWSFHFINLYLL